ncbi:OsmC family protein [Acetobacter senegalensis]|uniref:OsmC family protein n=1 Tax=Acetobacter senegalensis TaxID=446692 RepID=UPI0029CA133B|nr:OsmC family protein [Acetobacter senegalensis]
MTEGQYRTLSYVGDHAPVVVDEPLHLFGQNTAPAPGEIVLSALGGCLAVGITAVATYRQVKLSKLELWLEGDIGNTAAWGAGGADRKPEEMGFKQVRVRVNVEGDAPRDVLDEIVAHANTFSPVANTLRNPVPLTVSLTD